MAISSPAQTPGNEPSSPKFSPDQLKNAEESAASPYSTSTASGKIAYGKKSESSAEPSLYSSNAGGENRNSGSSNTLDSGEESLYNPRPKSNKSGVTKLLGTRRRQTIAGGGLIGIVLGIVAMFSLLSGPFEFIHISQLLTQFHFSVQQDQQNDRFMKEVRYIRYAVNGKVENTRMGFLGNKFTNTFESKLNTSGLVSTYSDKFGRFNGYAIDTTSKDSPFYGMDDAEAKQAALDLYGVEPVRGSTITGISKTASDSLIIDGSKLGFLDSLRLNSTVLQKAGYSKISAAIGARQLCVRAGCTSLLHPLTKLANAKQATIDNWFNNRNKNVKEGSTVTITETGADPTDPESTAAEDAINSTSAESEKAVDPSGLAKFKASLALKFAGGGAAALGLVCMVKTVNDNAGEIKQAQIVLPLIRMGIESMAIGDQIMSGKAGGKDVDLNELSKYSSLLNGVDSTTNKSSSWDQAASIQAELGNTNAGIKANKTLDTIGQGAPFDDLINQINQASPVHLNTACGTIVQGSVGVFSLALDFTGIGEAINAISAIIVQSVGQGVALNLISSWLSGNAINPDAAGADYGNDINYGAKLAANDQALASGGRQLSNSESGQLTSAESAKSQSLFQDHNIAYKLFNPYDERSAISKIIDNSSQNPVQNIAKMGSAFLNFGHMFSSLASVFSPKAHAATTTGYDYGFPTFGFSQAEMDNPLVQNPYANADDVATYLSQGLTGASGKSYVDQAKKCFNITLFNSNDSNQWDVTSDPNTSSQYDAIPTYCSSDSDSKWLQVRFFIMDTETMNSMACYAGDSTDQDVAQACDDVGFGGSASNTTSGSDGSTTTGPAGSLPSGTSQQLAQQLLPYISSGKIVCGSAVGGSGPSNCADIQNTAVGQPLGGSCQVGALTPHLLGLILGLVRDDGWTLGISAMCSDHHAEGDGPYAGHSYGSVADFSVQNGASGAAAAADEKFVDDAAALLSTSGGSFGQIQCHPPYAALSSSNFTTFDDTCNHQHIRAAP